MPQALVERTMEVTGQLGYEKHDQAAKLTANRLMSIMNELKNRGVQDILLAAVNGWTGFPEAIAAVFPKTEVHLCMVHLVRNSVRSDFSPPSRTKIARRLSPA
jgi:transposase-like protein